MMESILESLHACLPAGTIEGVYGGGSSLKGWDSVIDYVPELSDVDVHILLTDPALLEQNLDRVFAFQAEYERRFAERFPDPIHYPRPQIMVINRHLANPAFLPGPPGTGRTLFGKPLDKVRPQPADFEFVRKTDRESLIQERERQWIAGLPDHLIDRPGKYLWQPVRDASWRVAPTGPRVLSVLGASFAEAWGHNRTGVHARLIAAGQTEFAEAYAGYYLEGWAFFLSGYREAEHGRAALRWATRVIELGAEVGQE